MSTGKEPDVRRPTTLTNVPTELHIKMELPPGGRATQTFTSQQELLLHEVSMTATGPALIRIKLTQALDPAVPTRELPVQSFQEYLEQELPVHLSALVDEERTEWERKNGALLTAADAGDHEAFFELLGRDPRQLTAERTLRRIITWRTEIDLYYRSYAYKASQFWSGEEERAEARHHMEQAKTYLHRIGQSQLTLLDQRGKRPLPPAGHVRGIYYGLLCVIHGIRTLYKEREKRMNPVQREHVLGRFVGGLKTLKGDSLFLTYVVAASHLLTEPQVDTLTGSSSTPLSMLSVGPDLSPSDTARVLAAAAFEVSEDSIERLCAAATPIPLPSPDQTERWFLAGRPEFVLLNLPEVQALRATLSC